MPERMVQHKAGTGSKFCAKYGIDKPVHVEPHESILDAITREKAIKKWERAWKVALIERDNPDWRDLWFDLNR
jgi:putative endonuclease